jgi:hypothetical protein
LRDHAQISIHESQPILPWKNSLARESEEKSISSLQWISNSQRVFALVFTALRTVAHARCFSHFVFAPRYADFRFAAKISQTVEKAAKSYPSHAGAWKCIHWLVIVAREETGESLSCGSGSPGDQRPFSMPIIAGAVRVRCRNFSRT